MQCPRCHAENAILLREATNINKYRCVKCKIEFFARECKEVRKKTYHAWAHQGKELRFTEALDSVGVLPVSPSCARILLSDVDVSGRVGRVEKQLVSGKSVMFVYPHAARPFIGWDGLFQPSGYTTGVFVFAEGHKDVLQAYGYEKPLHTVGWSYSKIKQFQSKELRSILFAPIHPNANGWLSELDKRINKAAFNKVAKVATDTGAKLTVRHVKDVEANGLVVRQGVKYVNATTELTDFEAVLGQYDLIVSHQTLAYISVALGIPTLMMGEYEAPRNGNSEEKFKRVANWSKYKHMLMYPLDILDCANATDLALRACEYEVDTVVDWKRRMVGQDEFSAQKVIDVIQKYL